ncbi:hypothetical protein BH10PSE11_BH10PSE11_36620 [soil metagenome]
MSKKTHKKSSKLTSTDKVKKAKAAKPVAAKTSAASSAGKSAKKAKAKGAAAKAAPPKKTTARTTKSKQVTTPVRMVGALVEGKPAPAFSLPRDGGQLVSLSAYAGRKLVIFFYPRADTPGCTLEAAAFSRLANAFAEAQTAVLGVSADPVSAQEAFRDKHELTVPLASDEKLGMLKAYGVWGEKSMYGKTFMGIVRTTVLVDSTGKVARIWRNVRVEGHADEVLAAARIS